MPLALLLSGRTFSSQSGATLESTLHAATPMHSESKVHLFGIKQEVPGCVYSCEDVQTEGMRGKSLRVRVLEM